MTVRLNDARILMYSHDSFGLGHLRRCRTIAHALVEDYRGLNVLIISGASGGLNDWEKLPYRRIFSASW